MLKIITELLVMYDLRVVVVAICRCPGTGGSESSRGPGHGIFLLHISLSHVLIQLHDLIRCSVSIFYILSQDSADSYSARFSLNVRF